jgi:regulator of RNase E activity RraB
MKTQASMGVFNSMGKELEKGAKEALWAAYDVISHNITADHPVFDDIEVDKKDVKMLVSEKDKLGEYATIAVTGITDIIKRSELIQKVEAAMQKAVHPLFARYHKPYNLIKTYYEVIGLEQYEAIVDADEAEQVDANVAAELEAAQAEYQAQPLMEKKPVGGNKGEVREGQEGLA